MEKEVGGYVDSIEGEDASICGLYLFSSQNYNLPKATTARNPSHCLQLQRMSYSFY